MAIPTKSKLTEAEIAEIKNNNIRFFNQINSQPIPAAQPPVPAVVLQPIARAVPKG